MEKLVIDRQKWQRGNPVKGSLLTAEGTMCCLGFYCKLHRLTDGEIAGRSMPQHVASEVGGKFMLPNWLFLDMAGSRKHSSYDAAWLAEINDNQVITDAERETKIKEIFAKYGVEVEFIN